MKKMFLLGGCFAFVLWGTAAMPQTGGPDTVTAATVTTASTQMLAAGQRTYLSIQNVGAANPIACAFGAAAALNTAGSFQIATGVQLKFDGGSTEQGYLFTPTIGKALNCIAGTGSTPATIESH